MKTPVADMPTTRSLGRTERLIILRTFEGFTDMEPSDVSVLAEHTRKRFFPAGAVIAREGAPATAIHFIVHGAAELHRHGHPLTRLGPRGTVGGVAALARDPDTPRIVAVDDTVTLEMRVEDMEDVFEDNFHILLSVARAIARTTLQLRRELGPGAGFDDDEGPAVTCPARAFDLVERIFFLRQSLLFARMRIEPLAQLARHARELRVDAGTVLRREGEEPRSIILPICGRVRAHNAAGQQFHLGCGGAIGGLSVIADRPNWVTFEVVEPMVALSFDREIFLDVLEDHAEMARDFLAVLAAGLLAVLERRAGHHDHVGGVPVPRAG